MTVATQSEIVRATGTFVTNAVANTAQTDVLVAAPGVGFRLRIYWVSLTFVISAAVAPPAAGNGITFRVAQSSIPMAITWIGQPSDRVVIPQGMPLTANTALQAVEAASLASMNYYFGVGYVIESV